ncbi:MAG: redoxin domain-containing protein [Planctomycetota bacterium]|nr:redoxin domain-containing protein [Planctomycetota bacterium]
MRLGTVLTTLLCLFLVTAAPGQSRRMEDIEIEGTGEAPGLDIETWVKGEELTLATGRTHIVFFWSIQSQVSRAAFEPLTELQETYIDEGLKVIAITNDDVEQVERFVKRHDGEMGFTVAVDRRSSTQKAWQQLLENRDDITGLSFVVGNNGRLQIYGHPLAPGYEDYLARIVSGRFDATLEREALPRLEAARRARKTKTFRMAFRHYDDVIELDHKVFAETALERFEMMLVDMQDPEEAYTYAREKLMGEYFANDAGALGMLAEKIATDPDIPADDRDLDVALEAALAMMQIESDRDPKACAKVALVRYHRGELEQAVDLQKRAYFMARPKRKAGYKRVLEAYQEAAERVERVGG